MECLVYAANVM